jgi:cytochrome P450
LFRSIIESHKSKQNEPVESAASDEPTPEDEESVRFAGLNLISILLDSTTSTDAKGYPYDEAAMLAECFSVFGAGHDTTTRAGAFMYQMLAEHPGLCSRS